MIDLLLGPVSRYAATTTLLNPSEWLSDYFNGGFGSKTKSGIAVNQQIALTYAAVWCATRVLAEPCGFLPLCTYQRLNEDDRDLANDYFLYDILKTQPNDRMASEPFWEGRAQHMINWGNGFAEIERERDNPDAECVALHPIHPSRIRPATRADEADGYSYLVRNDDGMSYPMKSYEVLHIPGVLTDDGIWGKGVIQYAKECIGMGLATEKHGAVFFASGGQPKGIIKNLGGAKDREVRKSFRAEWREVHSAGPDEVAVLPMGSDYSPLSIPNEQAQFLQTRVHNGRDVARFYRVPLHMIMDLEDANNNTLEQTSLEFVTQYLWPWLRRIQGQCNLKLIPQRDRSRYYVEHNLAALLRGDIKSRYESYRIAINMGIMTINEARKLENLPSIGPAGDVHYVPLNMTTAERMELGLDRPQPGTGVGSDQNGTQPPQATAIEAKLDSLFESMAKHNSNGDWKGPVRDAARATLRQTLSWVFKKEKEAIRRGAAKDDFEKFADEFYAKHRSVLIDALGPSAQLLATLGVDETAETLSTRLIGDSRNRLTAALAASPATLIASLESWPTERAEKTAANIVDGNSNGHS